MLERNPNRSSKFRWPKIHSHIRQMTITQNSKRLTAKKECSHRHGGLQSNSISFNIRVGCAAIRLPLNRSADYKKRWASGYTN